MIQKKQKSQQSTNSSQENTKRIEYKDYREKYTYVQLSGYKGEQQALQLQNNVTNKIYQLVEKKISIKAFDTEKKRYDSLSHLTHNHVLELVNYAFLFVEENHGEPYCKVHFVFENTETDLWKWLHDQKASHKSTDEDLIIVLIKQCIAAMAYLEEQNVSHGNLTFENIFINSKSEFKIMPNYFEKAKIIDTSHLAQKGMPKRVYYFSPEVYKRKNCRVPYEKTEINLHKADMFTLGMLILEIVTQKNYSELYTLYELDYAKLTEVLKNIRVKFPGVVGVLLSQMLEYNPDSRQDFVEFRKNLEAMALPDPSISLFAKVENSTKLQELINPDYIPQDYANDVESRVQHQMKKAHKNMKEIFHKNGSKYVGEVNENDEPEGVGSLWWANGDRYEGNWKNGLYDGEGLYFFRNGMKHFGIFEKGEITGLGVRYYLDNGLYFGEWKNGKNHGKGLYIWPDGEKFLGSFKEDEIEGVGVLSWLSGRKIEGIWKDSGNGIGLKN